MALEIITPPSVEPVSLAEVKLRLRVEHADEDSLITDMIAAARMRIEALTGLALVAQRVREWRDDWAVAGTAGAVVLALGPASAVHIVRTYSADGAAVTFDGANYELTPPVSAGRLVLTPGASWPQPGRAASGIEIEYDAGFGPAGSDVPGPLREAVGLLVSEAYAYRVGGERAEEADETSLPPAVAGLIAPYQRVRL